MVIEDDWRDRNVSANVAEPMAHAAARDMIDAPATILCRAAVAVARISGAGVALLGLLFSPGVAFAHITQGAAGGFGSGFAHPLTGPDHFLAMFAVGIWGAQLGGRAVWTLPVAFPLIMALGGLAGMLGLRLPAVELGIALSIIALGSAILFAWRPAEIVALALIAVFAICHGYAHGVELPSAADPADYAVGFVVATGFIHLLGIGVGLTLRKPFRGNLARGLGGAIVVGGLYFLIA
jgi:urease accessory protein